MVNAPNRRIVLSKSNPDLEKKDTRLLMVESKKKKQRSEQRAMIYIKRERAEDPGSQGVEGSAQSRSSEGGGIRIKIKKHKRCKGRI